MTKNRRRLTSLPWIAIAFSIGALAVFLIAISSNYSGFLELHAGVEGLRFTLDNRPTP